MGKIKVHIIAARGLVPFTYMGRYEIECVIKIGSQLSTIKYPSSLVQRFKNTNPVYNKIFHYDVDPSKDSLFIQFVDKDDFNIENKIGDVIIPLTGLRCFEEKNQWYKLEHTTSGEVNVAMTALDFDTTTTGVAQSSGLSVIPNAFPVAPSLYAPPPPLLSPLLQQCPPPPPPPPSIPQSPLSVNPLINDKNNEPQLPKVCPSDKNPFDESRRTLIMFRPEDLQRQFPHIAKGTFGVVFKGTVKGLNKTVVIKDMEIHNARNVEDWKRELQLMSQNRCPYIVDVLGYCAHGNILTIVMEYMENGSLYDVIHVKRVPLSLLQRMRMARHCAMGLAHLHNKGVLHRDIKSMNILVSKDYSCKLTDFGCAKLIDPGRQLYNTANSGTPLWMAPEVKKGFYSFSADVYSLGLVLYEIFENQLPYYDMITQTVHLPPQFKSAPVVYPCVNLRPESRPTAAKIVKVLNQMIRNIVAKVKDLLSAEELHQIKLSNEVLKQKGPVIYDEMETDEMNDIYRYLLNKDPIYVDELINCAYTGNNTPSKVIPTTPQLYGQQGPPPYPSFIPQQQIQPSSHVSPSPPLGVSYNQSPVSVQQPARQQQQQQLNASPQPPPYNFAPPPYGLKEVSPGPASYQLQRQPQRPEGNNSKEMNRNNNQQLIPLFDIIPKANPNGETPFTKDFSNSPLVHQKPSTSPSTSDLIDLSPYNVKDQQTPSQSQNLPQSLQIQIQPPPRSDQSWVVILNGNASVKYSQQIPSLYPKPSTESTSENNKSNLSSSVEKRERVGHFENETAKKSGTSNQNSNGSQSESGSGIGSGSESESKGISKVTKAFAQLFKGSGKKKKPNVEKAKKLYATYLDENAPGISHERAISALSTLLKNRVNETLIRSAVIQTNTPLISQDLFLQLYTALWFELHQEAL